MKYLLNLGRYDTTEDKKTKIFKVILDELKKCGYNVSFKLFEIKLYDVPEKRELCSLFNGHSRMHFIIKVQEQHQFLASRSKDTF